MLADYKTLYDQGDGSVGKGTWADPEESALFSYSTMGDKDRRIPKLLQPS